MSYCRFSTDDYQCDLYCYADASGGYTTHVASNRRIFAEPLPAPVPLDDDHMDIWLERHNKVMAMVEKAGFEPLALPYDGESFNDGSLEDFLERLLQLKQAGYRFPEHVLKAVERKSRKKRPPARKEARIEPPFALLKVGFGNNLAENPGILAVLVKKARHSVSPAGSLVRYPRLLLRGA